MSILHHLLLITFALAVTALAGAAEQRTEEVPVCMLIDAIYSEGAQVKDRGGNVLRCESGVWVAVESKRASERSCRFRGRVYSDGDQVRDIEGNLVVCRKHVWVYRRAVER